jgi:hypothetical protein
MPGELDLVHLISGRFLLLRRSFTTRRCPRQQRAIACQGKGSGNRIRLRSFPPRFAMAGKTASFEAHHHYHIKSNTYPLSRNVHSCDFRGFPGLNYLPLLAFDQPLQKEHREIGNIVNKWTCSSALCALLFSSLAHANDFPTQARVEYVLGCMESHGGQKYENLYSCVCAIDKIAQEIEYDEYVEGEVFAQLRSTPGERGGVFRDPDRASLLTQKLSDIIDVAEKSCFVESKTHTANNQSVP